MAIHPETAAFGIAYGMVDMLRRAGQVAADRRDQQALDAWASELAAARGNASEMASVAAMAIREVAGLTAENAELLEEVAHLRRVLAQRNRALEALRRRQ